MSIGSVKWVSSDLPGKASRTRATSAKTSFLRCGSVWLGGRERKRGSHYERWLVMQLDQYNNNPISTQSPVYRRVFKMFLLWKIRWNIHKMMFDKGVNLDPPFTVLEVFWAESMSQEWSPEILRLFFRGNLCRISLSSESGDKMAALEAAGWHWKICSYSNGRHLYNK